MSTFMRLLAIVCLVVGALVALYAFKSLGTVQVPVLEGMTVILTEEINRAGIYLSLAALFQGVCSWAVFMGFATIIDQNAELWRHMQRVRDSNRRMVQVSTHETEFAKTI